MASHSGLQATGVATRGASTGTCEERRPAGVGTATWLRHIGWLGCFGVGGMVRPDPQAPGACFSDEQANVQ
jgi:hypothetical protein